MQAPEALDVDDDDLAAEVDVYLSQPPLHRELYVLDYPSRSADGAPVGSDRAVEGVRVRRAHRRIEIKLSVFPRDDFTGSSDLSFETGEDRPHGNERYSEESQLFLSCPAAPPSANFAAGTYVPPQGVHEGNGSVVLVPVHKVAKMRPSFVYLDEVDAEQQRQKALMKAEREKEKGTLDSSIGVEDDAGAEDGEVQVEMTFTKRESDRAAERRRHSYAHLAKLESEDPWVDLDFVDHSNPQIPGSRDALFSPVVSLEPASSSAGTNGVLARVVKAEDGIADSRALALSAATKGDANDRETGMASYIDRLYTHAPGANPMRDPSRHVGVLGGPLDSIRALKAERPESALSKILTSARVARFETLRECAQASTDDETLLSIVRRCAFLLRGCWVTALPRQKMRKFTGARMSPRLPAARNLILEMFRRQPVVSVAIVFESTFAAVVPPSEEFIREVLSEVGEYETGLGYVFRAPKDSAFIENHPDVVVEENEKWDARVREAREVMVTGGRSGARTSGAGRGGGARG
jgi:RPC5 protein